VFRVEMRDKDRPGDPSIPRWDGPLGYERRSV
jgi:hypothetical protein